VVRAWGSDQINLTCGNLIPRCFLEWKTYLLNHLINLLLPHKQYRGRKNTLEEFIFYTFVDPTNTLVLDNREDSIKCGLVLGVTGLEPALYNAERSW